MDLIIIPSKLSGTVNVPPSKSYTHRALIAAALAGGGRVKRPLFCEDTLATLDSLKGLGFAFDISDDAVSFGERQAPAAGSYRAGESASTLRFMLPVIAAFRSEFFIAGSPRLLERVETPDLDALTGLRVTRENEGLSVRGRLEGGVFRISGKKTTQLASGMILALPLLPKARLEIVDIDVDDPYVSMTMEVGRCFGISYVVSGRSVTASGAYRPADFTVEGDFSHAANWLAAACLNPGLKIAGLNPASRQGDRAILPLMGEMGVHFQNEDGGYRLDRGDIGSARLDISDNPDLGPILSAMAAVGRGEIAIVGTARLKYKESDRRTAIVRAINALGGRAEIRENAIVVKGVGRLPGGVRVTGAGDHRIVMALAAIASRVEKPFVIEGADAVTKSYPDFFTDYQKAGGKIIIP